jgi:SecD/SecF fusion protein
MGMIAALLTIIGYSLNDTIVVFDRIRENRGKLAHASASVINDSVNQTLSRTFLTGGGVLMSVLLLYFIGGETVRGFALAMFVGIVAGTYSSIALASPMLLIGTGPRPGPGTGAQEKSPRVADTITVPEDSNKG